MRDSFLVNPNQENQLALANIFHVGRDEPHFYFTQGAQMKRKLLGAGFIVFSMLGCASTGLKESTAGIAERKISQAIGEEIGNFKVASRIEGVSAPAGFSEGIYTVMTNGGKQYKCSILEPSGFMSVMSLGGAGSAGAMCTDFTKGSKQQGKTNTQSCNELLRASGKC